MIKIKVKARKLIPQCVLHFILVVSLFMVLYPLLMMIFGAFKSGTEYNQNKFFPALPLRITNISDAFDKINGYLMNTIIVGVLGISGLIFISSMAAFAMTKLRFIGSSVCFAMIMALTMMPGILSLTPQFLLYQGLGLQDSIFALVLPYWTGSCVFGVFLLKGFYGGLPNELFEAAELDGAGSFQKYVMIAVPLSLPIIATLVIMQITNVWNDLLWPKLIMSPENYTIAAGLAFSFETVTTIAQPIKFAGYLVASVPVVLLFVFFNRFYVEGLASSGIKL